VYFSDVYTIFYELLKFNDFLEIENEKQNWKKGLKWRWAHFGPRPRGTGPVQWLKPTDRPTLG
jgi:hypothetical protein